MAGGFKPHKLCKVCIAVRADKSKRLFKRIYASKHYIKGGEALLTIANEEGLQYPALIAHCRKHQSLTEEKYAEAQLQEVARVEGNRALQKMIRTNDARQNVVDKLHDKLENLDLDELTGRDVIALLLKATKDTDDVMAKKKDQDFDIFRAMGGVRSGELPQTTAYEDFDPWKDIEEGVVVEPQE